MTFFCKSCLTIISYYNRSLGYLHTIEIWHDNSGKGTKSSWYLQDILIKNMSTKNSMLFKTNSWLALDEGDGRIHKTFEVCPSSELHSFRSRFQNKASSDLRDGHIWFSVFSRPLSSNFSRLQRSSCCLCLLLTSMVANAMFYGAVPENSSKSVSFGPFNLSYEQVISVVFCITNDFYNRFLWCN